MLCGVADDDLMIRVNEKDYAALSKKSGIDPMVMKGKPFGTFLFVKPSATRGESGLKKHLEYAIRYVKELPAK